MKLLVCGLIINTQNYTSSYRQQQAYVINLGFMHFLEIESR